MSPASSAPHAGREGQPSSGPPALALEVRDLRFSWPRSTFRLALERLTLRPLRSLAVVGPSGCGKTTLLHLLAGIRVPDSGCVLHLGAPVSTWSARARRRHRLREVGLVFQEFELLEYLGVRENVLLPYRLDRELRLDREAGTRADALIERVGLKAHRARRPSQLSQGERQRVGLCRALVTRPKLLLADEPTGNLDPENAQRTVALLREVAQEAGAALVVVTHDHDLLPAFDEVLDLGTALGWRAPEAAS